MTTRGGYPTAYRSGSHRYAAPQGLSKAASAETRGGIESQPGGFYSGRSGMPTQTGQPTQFPGIADKFNQLFGELPQFAEPPGPNPYNKSPMAQPLGQVAMSAGALAKVAARQSAVGRAVDMAALAWRLYKAMNKLSISESYSNPTLGMEVCKECGPVGKYWGLHDPFGVPPHGVCSTVPCGDIIAFSPIMDFWPDSPVNRIIGLGNQGVIEGNPNSYRLNAEWVGFDQSIPDPNVPIETPWKIGMLWSGFPEMMPIDKPTGNPRPIPYSEIPGFPQTDTRVSGPPVRPPPLVPVLDAHMKPPHTRVQERKAGFDPVMMFVANAITESADALECVHKQVPKSKKKKVLGRKFAGDTLYYWQPGWAARQGKTPAQIASHNAQFKMGRPVHQTPQRMASEILDHAMGEGFSKQDTEEITKCMAQTALTDIAIGQASRKTTANLKGFMRDTGQADRFLHIGSGPAL